MSTGRPTTGKERRKRIRENYLAVDLADPTTTHQLFEGLWRKAPKLVLVRKHAVDVIPSFNDTRLDLTSWFSKGQLLRKGRSSIHISSGYRHRHTETSMPKTCGFGVTFSTPWGTICFVVNVCLECCMYQVSVCQGKE